MARGKDRPRSPQREAIRPGLAALDPSEVLARYEEHGPELRRFVLGVTRDPHEAGDVIQATFAKVVEFGHTARVETFKSWLFRVALNEALAARRRRESRDDATRRLTFLGLDRSAPPDERLIRGETVEAVRKALDALPDAQRRVVRARIYEDRSFAEIAAESGVPLGTVLTRMRLAVDKLKRALRAGE